ncbi:DNA polymerase zeta catalytic subunit [Portunus trituberculatus]|uniref:DNA polymerase zeta catalytic subunit n=1 Tax=Portunus trituberculatus TaxID=210409 RepID=A0A5B7I2X6_PORTR|nr:DNA polymerase zeta catalytic subunit [Portunus trituberculatus]
MYLLSFHCALHSPPLIPPSYHPFHNTTFSLHVQGSHSHESGVPGGGGQRDKHSHSLSCLTGQKACTHIHGVFPYILVPYDGSAPLATLPYTLATSLDRALNTALGHASANTQHVYKVTPVSGM